MTECRYRGSLIGWLWTDSGGFLRYAREADVTPIRTRHFGTILVSTVRMAQGHGL